MRCCACRVRVSVCVCVWCGSGWVQTEMGNAGAKHVGMKEAPMTVAQSVAGIVKLVDESTRDTHSGKFWSAEDNTQLPW